MNTKDVAIISCGKSKKDNPSVAKELYNGTSFRVYRKYVTDNFTHWVIISAKHGLVFPDQILEPYDVYMKDLSKEEREKLCDDFCRDLKKKFPDARKFIFLIGGEYKKPLISFFDRYQIDAEFPLDGLSFGQKLQYMRTGDSSKLILEELVNYYREHLEVNKVYNKKYLSELFRERYPNRYSPTYIRRRIASLSINEGDSGMVNYPLLYKIDENNYCLKESDLSQIQITINKKLF